MPIRTLIVIRQERTAQVPISDVEDVVAGRAAVDDLPMRVEVFAIEVVDAEDWVLALGVGGLHDGEIGEGEGEEGEGEERGGDCGGLHDDGCEVLDFGERCEEYSRSAVFGECFVVVGVCFLFVVPVDNVMQPYVVYIHTSLAW